MIFLLPMIFLTSFRIYSTAKLSNYVTLSPFQNPFLTDNFKKYSKKNNPKITNLGILDTKQPEIIKYKIFMRFKFITKPCSQE